MSKRSNAHAPAAGAAKAKKSVATPGASSIRPVPKPGTSKPKRTAAAIGDALVAGLTASAKKAAPVAKVVLDVRPTAPKVKETRSAAKVLLDVAPVATAKPTRAPVGPAKVEIYYRDNGEGAEHRFAARTRVGIEYVTDRDGRGLWYRADGATEWTQLYTVEQISYITARGVRRACTLALRTGGTHPAPVHQGRRPANPDASPRRARSARTRSTTVRPDYKPTAANCEFGTITHAPRACTSLPVERATRTDGEQFDVCAVHGAKLRLTACERWQGATFAPVEIVVTPAQDASTTTGEAANATV